MVIRFSRHAKRRMRLYQIDQQDVARVTEEGNKHVKPDGKLSFIAEITGKFK